MFESLLKLYFKNITDVLQSHRLDILKSMNIVVNPGENFPEGSNSNNRFKYFDQRRPYFVCDIIKKTCAEYIKPAQKLNVLDVGCGIGDFSKMFNLVGNTVIGINSGATWYLEDFTRCNKLLNLNVHNYDITKPLPFPDKHFDLVFCSEILTLGTLIGLQEQILGNLSRICQGDIVVINHDNRKLTSTSFKYYQYAYSDFLH